MSERHRRAAVPLQEICERYPSLTVLSEPGCGAAWNAVFRARPDVLHQLLADYIKQVYTKPGHVGQRPVPREEQVDFHGLIFGYDNDEPLIAVVPKLLKGSQRAFATGRLVGVSRTQLRRILSGQRQPAVHEIRAIASAVGKPPVFFVEYRKAMVQAAFKNLIDAHPGIATSLYRKYLQVRQGPANQKRTADDGDPRPDRGREIPGGHPAGRLGNRPGGADLDR